MTKSKFEIHRLLNEPDHFLYAPKHLRNNKKFIEKCAQENGGDFFIYVDDKFKQDENFVFHSASLHSSPYYLKQYKGYVFCQSLWGKVKYFSIPKQYRHIDSDIALAIAYEGRNLDHYSPELAYNTVSAFFFCSYHAYNFKELSPVQQSNPYLALAATMDSSFPIDLSIYQNLWINNFFCKIYMICKAEYFLKIPNQLQNSKKFINQTLSKNYEIFQFLPNKLKKQQKYLDITFNSKTPLFQTTKYSNRNLYIYRSSKQGDQLFHADPKLHTSNNLFRAARLGISSLDTYQGKINAETARKLVEINTNYFYLLPPKFHNNDLIIRTAIYKNPDIISILDENLDQYAQYILIALKQNGRLLKTIPQHFHTDHNIKIAIKSAGEIILDLDKIYQSNRELALIAVKQHPEIFCNLNQNFQSDLEFIWAAIKANPNVYKYLQKSLKNNSLICEYTFAKLPRMAKYIPKKFLKNESKVLAAIQIDPSIWEYLPQNLQKNIQIATFCLENSPQLYPQIMKKIVNFSSLEYIKKSHKNLDIYTYLPLEYREDPELAIKAIEFNFDHIYSLPVTLMKNDHFMKKIYKFFRQICKKEWKQFKKNWRSVVKTK